MVIMRTRRAPLAITLIGAVSSASRTAAAAVNVTAHGHFGLFATDAFTVALGEATQLPPAQRLYFADEYIAARTAPMSAEDYTPGVRPFADIRAWARTAALPTPRPPTLVWLGSSTYVEGARLAADAASVVVDGRTVPFATAPKLPLNRSFFDASSAHYLSARPLTLRGEIRDGVFVARTLWPEDFALAADAPVQALPAGTAVADALRAMTRATPDGGARETWQQRRLWTRAAGAGAPVAGRPVLVVMVNGAQGDDDEAWGGHFALGTGFTGLHGRLSDVMVNNFYSLDIVSEKGILAAPTPLDHYLADVNSGQAWYRPSSLLVATLRDARAAATIQGALDRVFVQLWRHQLVYQHSTMNCASISIDTLRALGWNIPARGPTSRVMGWLGFPYALVRYQSVAQARNAYEYMTEDRTRLFPQVAFEDIGAELLRLATLGATAQDGTLARALAEDLVSIDYVQVPQLPSSRKFGSWAVASTSEYLGKVPRDPADAQIVPVPPRAFPDALRDPDLLRAPPRRSDVPLVVWGALATALLGLALRWLLRALP